MANTTDQRIASNIGEDCNVRIECGYFTFVVVKVMANTTDQRIASNIGEDCNGSMSTY